MLPGKDAPEWAPKQDQWIKYLDRYHGAKESCIVKVLFCDDISNDDEPCVRLWCIHKQRLGHCIYPGVSVSFIEKDAFEVIPEPFFVKYEDKPHCPKCQGKKEGCGDCMDTGIDILTWKNQLVGDAELTELKALMDADSVHKALGVRCKAGEKVSDDEFFPIYYGHLDAFHALENKLTEIVEQRNRENLIEQ